MSRQSLQAIGEASFSRSERVSAELMALTYGSFVRQLLLDYEDPSDVNKQLDSFGYNIGVRLVDDFLAKSKINHCSSLSDTAEVIAKVAFKMFLGITAIVTKFSNENRSFSLVFDDNPLAEFTELPENCSELWYSNLLCGVIRGALEMINMKVECTFERCKLRGDDQNEIGVKLHEILVEQRAVFCGIISSEIPNLADMLQRRSKLRIFDTLLDTGLPPHANLLHKLRTLTTLTLVILECKSARISYF